MRPSMRQIRFAAACCWLTMVDGVAAEPPAEPPLSAAQIETLRAIIREELKAEQEGKVVAPPADGGEVTTSFSNGIRWRSADQAFALHLGGRFEWDNAWFSQSDNLLIGPSAGTRFQDGTVMRRARLRADGTVWNSMDFVFEVNFANIQDAANVNDQAVLVGSVGLTDVWVQFRDVPLVGNVRLGHFVAPYGLERFSSSNTLNYMERSSSSDAFWGPNLRQSGIMVYDGYLDQRVGFFAAFTRVGQANLNSLAFDAMDGNYAAGARVTAIPWLSADGLNLLHLGINGFHQALSNNSVQVANRLPLRAGAGSTQVPNLLDTGTFYTPDGATIAAAEAALIAGPVSASGEFTVGWLGEVFEKFDGLTFSRPRGRATYFAYYLEMGCFLTPGDRRACHRTFGVWDVVVPVQNALGPPGSCRWGTGAWEVVARFSAIDLVSGDPPLTPTADSAGARAGRQRDVTIGLNWYLNPQTRCMINYVYTQLDSVVPGASGTIHGFGTRIHFHF